MGANDASVLRATTFIFAPVSIGQRRQSRSVLADRDISRSTGRHPVNVATVTRQVSADIAP